MSAMTEHLEALHRCLDDCAPVAVAVSGGVDSMTLAFVAHRRLGTAASLIHAASAAVPPMATRRIEAYAAREGWALTIFDAGEFADERYLANPANRCFFCKSNLYRRLAAETGDQLLSGTNLDDLGDWRPGLQAAEANHVRHPFVEAGINKAAIRRLASFFGLDDLAELPSAPCLSSRVETGLRIEPALLPVIDRVEVLLRARLSSRTVRCRIRKDGVVIELDQMTIDALNPSLKRSLADEIEAVLAGWRSGPVAFEAYRRGSAFLRDGPTIGVS